MIRHAIIDDSPRLAEIHVFSWRVAYSDFLPEELLFNSITVANRTAEFQRSIGESRGETFVFEHNSIIKGFITFGKSRDKDKSDFSFEIYGIYVDPCFCRKGVGSALLQYSIDIARQRKYKEASLWVFKKNLPAQLLYQRNGFLFDGADKLLDSLNEVTVRLTKIL